MAGLDRRLQAHQESFTLWRELSDVPHTEGVGKVVLKCQSWWEQNCLYLEPSVREAFVSAYSAANSHHALVQGRARKEDIKASWERVTAFPNILFRAIQLPPLSESEA